MDYKEKFEDFLDKMQGLLDDANKKGHIIVRLEDLENAFPELAEREDCKIKEAAIDYADCARTQPKDYCINSIADYDNGIREGFIAGANWQKEQMIDKACEWLNENSWNYILGDIFKEDEMIEDFRKAMEAEK